MKLDFSRKTNLFYFLYKKYLTIEELHYILIYKQRKKLKKPFIKNMKLQYIKIGNTILKTTDFNNIYEYISNLFGVQTFTKQASLPTTAKDFESFPLLVLYGDEYFETLWSIKDAYYIVANGFVFTHDINNFTFTKYYKGELYETINYKIVNEKDYLLQEKGKLQEKKDFLELEITKLNRQLCLDL